jgi:hypothetical protein
MVSSVDGLAGAAAIGSSGAPQRREVAEAVAGAWERAGPRLLLLAQSGHFTAEFQCPLLGVKRTLVGDAAMSAFDPKRTLPRPLYDLCLKARPTTSSVLV